MRGYGVAIATAGCRLDFVKEFLQQQVSAAIFTTLCAPATTPSARSLLLTLVSQHATGFEHELLAERKLAVVCNFLSSPQAAIEVRLSAADVLIAILSTGPKARAALLEQVPGVWEQLAKLVASVMEPQAARIAAPSRRSATSN